MPSGVLSGWLEKRGNGGLLGSAFRARWFVLDTEGTVRYYKVQPTKASDVPQGYFNVQGAEMHTTSGAEFDVAVQELIEGQAGAARTQTRRVFHIRAESVMARDRWLAALQAAAGGKASSLNWSALAALQVPLASDDSDRDLASSSVPHLPTPPPQVVQDLSVPSLPAAGDDLASTEQLMGCISLQGSSLPSTPPPAPLPAGQRNVASFFVSHADPNWRPKSTPFVSYAEGGYAMPCFFVSHADPNWRPKSTPFVSYAEGDYAMRCT